MAINPTFIIGISFINIFQETFVNREILETYKKYSFIFIIYYFNFSKESKVLLLILIQWCFIYVQKVNNPFFKGPLNTISIFLNFIIIITSLLAIILVCDLGSVVPEICNAYILILNILGFCFVAFFLLRNEYKKIDWIISSSFFFFF